MEGAGGEAGRQANVGGESREVVDEEDDEGGAGD